MANTPTLSLRSYFVEVAGLYDIKLEAQEAFEAAEQAGITIPLTEKLIDTSAQLHYNIDAIVKEAMPEKMAEYTAKVQPYENAYETHKQHVEDSLKEGQITLDEADARHMETASEYFQLIGGVAKALLRDWNPPLIQR